MSDIHLLQITDTHLFANPGAELGGVTTEYSLQLIVQRLQLLAADTQGILATGDLVHDGSRSAYERLDEHLHTLDTTVFYLPGNHDDPAVMGAVLNPDSLSWQPFVVRLGDWRLIMLSTWQLDSDAGYLNDVQLNFLQRALHDEPEIPVLIGMHHPPVDIGSPWLDRMGVGNAGEFWRLIGGQKQVRAIVSGHIHQELDIMHNGVRVLGTPSTCFQFLPGSEDFAHDILSVGFRHLRLNANGSFDTQVERL